MRKRKFIIVAFGVSVFSLFFACKKSFLKQDPKGQITEDQLVSSNGVEQTLIGAYGLLNGGGGGTWDNVAAPSPAQILIGETGADNAHKGSEPENGTQRFAVGAHTADPSNSRLKPMWTNYYEGIARCNNTLKLLNQVMEEKPNEISPERAKVIQAEARMLRGHYYFYLWRVFRNIPWVDETMSNEEAFNAPNDGNVFSKILAEFQFANDNLPEAKPFGQVGRVNKIAASAYLGKIYLYAKNYDAALPLFLDVISSKPDLEDLPFMDNFNIETEDGPETIFSVQHAINPDGSGDNAYIGDFIAGMYGSAPITCCGFFNPSIDLANAYKVDQNGLPFLNNEYRDNPYLSDFGLTPEEEAHFQVETSLRIDPRLDYTMGRVGVPYRDWGKMRPDWIRDPAYDGPFVAYKLNINEADFDGHTVSGDNEINSLNVNIIRLADVYLMAAECYIEKSAPDLNKALDLVNAVRIRASHLPHKEIEPGVKAADYEVKPYPSFPNKDYAISAVRMERRLELAEEGHRLFDLIRWGDAKPVLNSYYQFEGQFLHYYAQLNFTDRDTCYPIPQEQIDRAGGALVQNPGF